MGLGVEEGSGGSLGRNFFWRHLGGTVLEEELGRSA